MDNKTTAETVAMAIEKAYKGFRVGIKICGVKTGSDDLVSYS